MSMKKVSKDAFYDFASGSFSQKKKVALGNIKYSGDEKDIFLVKLGSGGMYSDIDSESNCGEDNIHMEDFNSESLLNSATNIPKVKRVNTSVIFGSFLGSPNYEMDDEIVKTPVEVSVKKSFVLDINLSAVEGKSTTAKTQLIRKIFSAVNGFGEATTLSKFEEIIRSTFTSEKNMKMAALLAKEKGIDVNSNLKKQEIKSDQTVIIKEIPINTPKDMIITAVSKFGKIKSIKIQLIRIWQKAMVEFAELNQANLLVSKWFFLIGKDSVCVVKAMGNHGT
ncbi:hypothetical protein G9A89_013694 [Geosiphon pyriformis]|nr:hypothetical protein G9A89_013694 [Geosiphon pyriformis]